MGKQVLLGMLMAGLAMGLTTARAAVEKAKDGVEAKAAFTKLKSLAGEWKVKGDTHHGDGKAPSVIYKVTAADSALMETQFPGSDHEMVTIYHLDGSDLILTHYCAAQNQPKMKLNREKSTADKLIFDFAGGTNFDPAKDMHIHASRLEFRGKKQVVSAWDAYKDGKPMHGVVFNLSR